MPFIQTTIAREHDAVTKRALVTQVSETAAAATGTLGAAFRVWIVGLDPDEVSVRGVILTAQRRERQG